MGTEIRELQVATDLFAAMQHAVTVPETGNSGTARKTQDSGRKQTVAVPELQRIQEPHRVILTGDDVFAQVRFPNSRTAIGV